MTPRPVPAEAAPRQPARVRPTQPSTRPRAGWLAWVAGYVAAGAGALALLHLWRGHSYWLFSEGVYLATARAIADGAELYTDVAAAQPPPLLLLGAGLLEVSDSLLFVRGALALATLVTGGLVVLMVWRLTGRPAVAASAGLVALVTPWTLREHATLTPDPLAAGPLLGAALLAARRGRTAGIFAGALGALGASLKLAFLLPVAAVAVAARRRGPYVAGALLLAVALAVPSFVAWGGELWENVVEAQGETGLQVGRLPGLLGQTAWNLGPLLALAALAWPARARARDPVLLRTATALLLGSLALTAGFVKDGTYLNQLAVVEPVAVALAACGLTWFLEDRLLFGARRRLAAGMALAACVLVALQSVSLLALPESPYPFGNPFLSRAPGHELSDAEVESAARAARSCPPGAPYSGSPFIAYVADRPLPGGQPDRFIVLESTVHADLREEVLEDGPLCPYPSLGGLPTGGAASPPFR